MEPQPRIGLSNDTLHEVSLILNTQLSDEFMLYTKTLNFHWNVYGMHFHDLHKFLEQQYEDLFAIIDLVAERVRALGHRSFGTLTEFSQQSRLKEEVKVVPTAPQMLAILLEDHEAIIRQLRKDIDICADDLHDMGTNNFLTDIMERHEKMAWMLRAFIQK